MDEARRTAEEIEKAGGKAVAVRTDVTDIESVRGMLDKTAVAFLEKRPPDFRKFRT